MLLFPKSDTEKIFGQFSFLSVILAPGLICVFLLATSVSVVFSSMHVLDSKRLLQVITLPIIFFISLAHSSLRNSVVALLRDTPRPVAIALLIVFFLGSISASRFLHPAYSLVEVGLFFSLLLSVFFIAGSRQVAGQHFDRLMLPSIAIIGIAVFLQETMGMLVSWINGSEFSYDDMFIYFAHPRFFNQLQTWILPIIPALPAIFEPQTRTRVLTLILIAANWYLMLASGARGSVVGVSFAIIIMGILAFPLSKSWLKYHVSGALLGFFGYTSILAIQKALTPTGGGEFFAQSVGRAMMHTTGRTWIWGYSWQDALQNPWLGSGPARFACNAEAELPGHSHNFAMQLLGEWGFPATILVLGLVMYLAWRMVRHAHLMRSNDVSGKNVLQLSLITSLTSGAIHSSVSGLLVMPASQMLAVLAGGWLLGLLSQSTPVKKTTTLPCALIAAGLLMSVAIASFGIVERQNLNFRLSKFTDAESNKPRFWHEGRVCRYQY